MGGAETKMGEMSGSEQAHPGAGGLWEEVGCLGQCHPPSPSVGVKAENEAREKELVLVWRCSGEFALVGSLSCVGSMGLKEEGWGKL